MNIVNLYRTFGGECSYCRRRTKLRPVLTKDMKYPHDGATKDHDVPKCRGGPWNASNEVLACCSCNNAKGDMTGPEFSSFRKTHKLAPSYIEWLEKNLLARMKS